MLISMLRGWRAAHRAMGSKTLSAIGPIATWTLPAGYAYDPLADAIRHTSSGAVLTPSSTHYSAVTTSIDYVPSGNHSQLQALIEAGLVPAGTLDVWVKASDKATVLAAWRVTLDGLSYQPDLQSALPAGAPDVAMIRLRQAT